MNNTAPQFIDMIYYGLLALVVFAIWLIVVRLNRIGKYIEKLEKKLEKSLFPYLKHLDEKNELLADALTKKDRTNQKILKALKSLVEKK